MFNDVNGKKYNINISCHRTNFSNMEIKGSISVYQHIFIYALRNKKLKVY